MTAVGAGLGVPLGLLLILIPIFFWLERKKTKRRNIQQSTNGSYEVSNAYQDTQRGTSLKLPAEARGDRAYQELAADGTTYELAARQNQSSYKE